MRILDPIELLEILGNENRRRILQLLSFRPFYFNEMAKRLDVGPKAVIDHLEMLERAGLIECYKDQSRRKYFRIAQKTVLEVSVSPHSYGVRAYRSEGAPKNEVSVSALDMKILNDEIQELERKRLELRSLIDEIETKEMEIKQKAAGAVNRYTQDMLESEILVALLSGISETPDLAEKLEVPEILIEDKLQTLRMRGIVYSRGNKWSI